MKVAVERRGSDVRVTARGSRIGPLVSLAAIAAVTAVAVVSPAPSDATERTIAHVALLFGALLAYACLVGLVNRLEVRIDARAVEIRSRPLPWPGGFVAARGDVRAVTATHERVVVRGVSRVRSEVTLAVGGESYPLPLGPVGVEDSEAVATALREALGL